MTGKEYERMEHSNQTEVEIRYQCFVTKLVTREALVSGLKDYELTGKQIVKSKMILFWKDRTNSISGKVTIRTNDSCWEWIPAETTLPADIPSVFVFVEHLLINFTFS